MRLLSIVVLAAATASLAGDPVAELRTKLQGLKPSGTFSARIEVKETGKQDDEGTAQETVESVAVEASDGEAGLRISWTPAQLAQARREALLRARNPDAPKSGGLATLDAEEAHGLLDAAEPLLQLLEGATLVEARDDKFRGQPARLLVLTPRDAMSEKDRKRIKQHEDKLKLWLDAEGWPLGYERTVHIKASFMLMSFTADNNNSTQFGRTGDRLWVQSRATSSSGAGMGQKGTTRRSVTVTALGAQAGAPGSTAAATASPRAGS